MAIGPKLTSEEKGSKRVHVVLFTATDRRSPVVMTGRCFGATWILASASLFTFGCGGDNTTGTGTGTGLPPGSPVATSTTPVPGQVPTTPGAVPTGTPTSMNT